MDAFPLFRLQSTNLEQVITKLDYKSYARLQQTCREISEFIQKSRRITVHLPGKWGLIQSRSDYRSYFVRDGGLITLVELKSLFGMRMDTIMSPFKDYYEGIPLLKNHRITCDILEHRGVGIRDQNPEFLEVVKPTNVKFLDNSPQLLEALFSYKGLKEATILMKAEEVLPALPKFPAKMRALSINLNNSLKDYCESPEEIFKFIIDIIKLVFFTPLPNFGRVSISGSWQIPFFSYDPFLRWHTEFCPDLDEPRVDRPLGLPELCWYTQRQNGSSCELKMKPDNFTFEYVANGQ